MITTVRFTETQAILLVDGEVVCVIAMKLWRRKLGLKEKQP